MKKVPLNGLFTIEYGNQFDLNKMSVDNPGVNFVSRSRENLGIVERVKPIDDIDPYPPGAITVTLGGTYLLSSFIQPEPFYTAQNIKVLVPKQDMSINCKLFYCLCIAANRFRYSSHGREGNKSLDTLLVPDLSEVPSWVETYNNTAGYSTSSALTEHTDIFNQEWNWFEYDYLFTIERGRGARKKQTNTTSNTPLVTSIDSNNGVVGYVDVKPEHPSNTITVNRNGSVGVAFYQPKPYCSTEDVHVFIPKFDLNIYIAMFLVPLISREHYRYSYGRKWGLERMKKSTIKLPVDSKVQPDWDKIEKYIKGLPFSSNL